MALPQSSPAHTPGIRRRHVLGSLLAASGVGLFAGTGWIGWRRRPRTLDVSFSRGTVLLPEAHNDVLRSAQVLLENPRLTVRVLGHSGTMGDREANIALSQMRAEAIARILRSAGVPMERVKSVVGMGPSNPLEREAGEGDREFERRLARATLVFGYRQ